MPAPVLTGQTPLRATVTYITGGRDFYWRLMGDSGLGSAERGALRVLSAAGDVRLGEAVELVSSRLGMGENEAARAVYLLWKKGYVDVFDEKALGSFSLFLFSVESLWFWALVAFVVFTSGLVLFVSKPPLVYLRYVFGAVLVLYVPGAALLEALYPSSELEPLERFALSIGLSLAVVPLIGLVLNYTPWGIRLEPVLYSLAIFSVSVGFVGVFEKYRVFRRELGASGPPR